MGDLFSGITNIRFPTSVWNQGPTPGTDGLPAPLNDPFDARYNYNSTLLGDLDPYAIGTSDRVANQVSYINKPHSIQKVIPKLHLPKGQVNTSTTFMMSHPVDDSDIAFALRVDKNSFVCTAKNDKSLFVSRLGTSIDPMINLVTLNYLLAGFQLCYTPGNKSKWADMLHHMDKTRFPDESKPLTFADIRYIVRELIRPFGVVRGSEKQGGQNEVGYSPATWPVSFVANLVIDGHERNVNNYWHFHEIAAGDDLVLRLKPMPIPPRGQVYTLNHYYKEVARQDFDSYFEKTALARQCTHVWQLVPDIFDLEYNPENCSRHDPRSPIIMPRYMKVPRNYVWQSFGYWHIGRSQISFRKYASCEFYHNDLGSNSVPLRLNHLDMTFQPMWQECPGEPLRGNEAIHSGMWIPARVISGAFGDEEEDDEEEAFPARRSLLRSEWRVMPKLPSPPRARKSQLQSAVVATGFDMDALMQDRDLAMFVEDDGDDADVVRSRTSAAAATRAMMMECDDGVVDEAAVWGGRNDSSRRTNQTGGLLLCSSRQQHGSSNNTTHRVSFAPTPVAAASADAPAPPPSTAAAPPVAHEATGAAAPSPSSARFVLPTPSSKSSSSQSGGGGGATTTATIQGRERAAALEANNNAADTTAATGLGGAAPGGGGSNRATTTPASASLPSMPSPPPPVAAAAKSHGGAARPAGGGSSSSGGKAGSSSSSSTKGTRRKEHDAS